MKPEDQIRAIAELDGYITDDSNVYCRKGDMVGTYAPTLNYLHSRDAIVPVIEKQKQLPNFGVRFTGIIDKIVQPVYLVDCVCATPAQLCEALLRATGKWKD